MLQYFINTSIIWLSCLLVYECLFRKVSFHQYNRIFLMTGVVAGILIPLANFNLVKSASKSTVLDPITKVYEIKKTAIVKQVNDISTTHHPVDFESSQILWWIYFLGVFVGLLFVIKEAHALFTMYKQGRKTKESACIIVETGKIHTVYSFSNIIFISSKSDYSPAQWEFLLMHEKEHFRQLHLIDNLILISLRIVFWFHPLVHLFFNKLRIVHEYQADRAAATDTAHYGLFLLEQNLLQGAPLLTHSFNYSPIKIRIAMLLKTKSTRKQLVRYLSVFPLFLLFILCCTQTSFSGGLNKNGKTITFKGNKIQFEDFKLIPYAYKDIMQQQKKMFLNVVMPDSIPIQDRTTGLTTMQKVETESAPAFLNGKPIFGKEEDYLLNDYDSRYTDPVLIGDSKNISTHIFWQLKNEFDKLDDGEYYLRGKNMVINDKGRVVFYENVGIDNYTPTGDRKPENAEALIKSIEEKMVSILNEEAKFKPALKDGQAIQTRFRFGNYQIRVKNHQSKILEGGGC